MKQNDTVFKKLFSGLCRKVFFVLVIVGYFNTVQAQVWVYVGKPGISSDSFCNYTTLVVDPVGTPYIAFLGSKVDVMKYDGSNWQYVGNPGLSNVIALYFAMDGSGTPYIAFEDTGYKVTVMNYAAGAWTTVGSPKFTDTTVRFISFAVDGSGTPYVAYSGYSYDGRAIVMKYNGSAWVLVGNPGFSAAAAAFIQIAIDKSGTPYVAYGDVGRSYRATVMKFDGSNWVNVGAPGFSAGEIDYPFIAIDGSGAPYVVYRDYANGKSVTAMKFNGSDWDVVGVPGFSGSYVPEGPSMAINAVNTPYVAFTDNVEGRSTVMKYNGSSWVTVGYRDFSESGTSFNSIAIDGNGTPYVVYVDVAYNLKPSVVKLDTAIKAIVNNINNPVITPSIYPNPTTGPFTLQLPQTNTPTTVTITNLLGSVIETRTIESTQPQNMNCNLHAPPGAYIIKVTSGPNTWRDKIEIW